MEALLAKKVEFAGLAAEFDKVRKLLVEELALYKTECQTSARIIKAKSHILACAALATDPKDVLGYLMANSFDLNALRLCFRKCPVRRESAAVAFTDAVSNALEQAGMRKRQ